MAGGVIGWRQKAISVSGERKETKIANESESENRRQRNGVIKQKAQLGGIEAAAAQWRRRQRRINGVAMAAKANNGEITSAKSKRRGMKIKRENEKMTAENSDEMAA